MPGVPSCKGCVACSKQKKKCDQAKPVCSRCHRLQIPCLDSGKQRYKFMQVVRGTSTTMSSLSAPSSFRSSLSRSPSNEGTIAVAEFAHRLEVKDIRYDLCWSYGELLREIPRRLGTNAALDASCSALSSAMSGLSIGRMSQETFSKFGLTVKTLRVSLTDPAFVYTPETLCAMFLIWICQSWFGEADDMTGHGPGIIRILSTVNFSKDTSDEFEQLLLVTIAGPVAAESVYDPNAQLNPWLKAFAIEKERASLQTKLQNHPAHGPKPLEYIGFLTCLVRLPDLLRYNPALQDEVREVYERLHITTEAMDKTLFEATANMAASDTPESIRHFALCQRSYALYLSLEIVVVGILHVYSPYDASIDQTSTQLCKRIIELCLLGSVWRPLGAAWTTICLASAWVATTDIGQRPAIEDAWSKCWAYGSGQSLSSAKCMLGNTFDRLRLEAWGSSTTPSSLPLSVEWDSVLDFSTVSTFDKTKIRDSSWNAGLEDLESSTTKPSQ